MWPFFELLSGQGSDMFKLVRCSWSRFARSHDSYVVARRGHRFCHGHQCHFGAAFIFVKSGQSEKQFHSKSLAECLWISPEYGGGHRPRHFRCRCSDILSEPQAFQSIAPRGADAAPRFCSRRLFGWRTRTQFAVCLRREIWLILNLTLRTRLLQAVFK